MSKLNFWSTKDIILNSRIKSQLNEKKIRGIRKTLLSLAEIDIKSADSFNIIISKKDENENSMAMPTIIPQKYYHEDLEKIKQNILIIENEINSDESELADSSDFENEDEE